MRVLYVEDDRRDADLARRELARHAPEIGMEIVLTLSDARARLAADNACDVVLADLRLPDGTGLDLLAEIRERSLPIAVVILTGQGDEATAVAALKAGADDYVPKREGYLTRLPFVLEAAVARFRAEAARQSEVLHVLYAEHTTADIDLTRRHLETHAPHIRLDVVHSAGEVLARLPRVAGEPCPWDVLLLDYRLPGVNALELLKTLRDERRVGMPVVLVTGQGDEEVAAQALRLGATDYLVKQPNYLFGLPAALENAHQGARLAREQGALRQKTAEMEGYSVILSTQQETSLDGILVVDEHGKVLSCNRRFVDLWSIPPDGAAAGTDPRSLESVVASVVDARGFLERVSYLYEHREQKSEEEIALKDGRTLDRYSAPMFGADGKYYGRVWYFRDITQRKRAEQALRESEARLQSLFSGIDDAIFVHDTEGRIVDCNAAACQRLGYSREELLGMQVCDVDAPDFAVGFQDRLREQFRRGRASCEGTHLTKDGREIPVDIETSVIDYHGTKCVLAVMRDISERRRAEERLRRSEAEYRGLVEHATLGIYRSTPEGRFLTVNPALVRMLGYARAEEMLELDMARDIYVNPERRNDLLAQFPRSDKAQTETEWKRKDGSVITVRLNVRTVSDPGGAIERFEGLVEDVTEQRSLESQFRQAQRLEAVGRLAGGVAHDFNNILTAITGYSDLLLEEIKAAALRATALTRQLLAFSRKQVLETRVLDLNGVVQTLDKMLRRLIGEDVRLEINLASGLGAVRADPGQIEQVILNLAVNSRDAMPDGGRLTLETANVDLDEAYAREHAGAAPGRYVMLAVSDTGSGMDAETRSHIFEPFFTTKEQGKGTGLGLATVYGIVRQSGGSIWAYSELGHGTTFKIYLPRVDEALAEAVPSSAEQPVAGGRETVLVAEDDPGVRSIVTEVLVQKGYRVMPAPDGQAAPQMARGQPGRIHILVTDLVMPGMTGRDLAESLMVERPGIRVLYMSGYTDDAVVRHGVLREGMPYLQKPFTPRALASKVREVLDRT